MRSAFSFVRISFPEKMFGVQETFDRIISLKMMKSLKDVLSFAPSKLIFLPPKPIMNYIYLSISVYIDLEHAIWTLGDPQPPP